MSDQINDTFQNTLNSISSNQNIDLDSLKTNLTNNIDKMGSVQSKLKTPKTVSAFQSFWTFFKVTLIVVIIGMLGINLYTFFRYKKDALSYFFGDIFNVSNDVEEPEEIPEEITEEVLEKQKDKNSDEDGTVYSKLDLAAENEKKETDENPDQLDNVLREKNEQKFNDNLEKNNNYKANNMSMNVNKKSGYCYLGEDRGVRSCVQVNEDDTCLSNQIFPTQELCVNPNLKE